MINYGLKQLDTNNFVVYSINEAKKELETKNEKFNNYFYVEKTDRSSNIIERYPQFINRIEEIEYIDGSKYKKIYLSKPIFECKDLIYGLKNYDCKIFENDISIESQFIFEKKIEILKDGIALNEIPYVVFDIEVETSPGVFPTPERNFIFYIGAKGVNISGENVSFYKSVADFEQNSDKYKNAEERLLDSFIEFINVNKFVILSGYNVFNFDINFIYERLKKYNKKFLFSNGELILDESYADKSGLTRHPAGGKKNIIKYKKFISTSGGAIFDLYFFMYRMPVSLQEIRYKYGSLTLKNVADYFNVLKIEKREMIEGSAIYTTFITDPLRVKEYLKDDVESTCKLYEKFASTMLFLSNIANVSVSRIFDMSPTKILESALMKNIKQIGAFIPQKTYEKLAQDSIKNYGGGFTELHARGFFENVIKLDFTSLYPSIMLNWKIKPKNDSLGMFTKTLEILYRKRLSYKDEAKKLELDLVKHKYNGENELSELKNQISFYKSGSDALKILINVAYGLMGFRMGDKPASRFTDLDAAGKVTAIGRNIITSIEDILLKNGFILIETDTDGAYLTKENITYDEIINQAREFVDKINTEFRKLGVEFVSIDFEDSFNEMVSIKKKNYFLVSIEGETALLKMKGSKFVNSGDPEIQKIILRDIINDITVKKLGMEELNKKYNYLFISSPLLPEEDFITRFKEKPHLFVKIMRAKSLSSYTSKFDIMNKRILELYFRKYGYYPIEGTDIRYYYTAVGGEAQRDRIALADDMDARKIDYKKYLKEIKQKFIEIILDVFETELSNTEKIRVEDKGNVTVRKSTNNPYYSYLFEKDWMKRFFASITDKHKYEILTTINNHYIIGITNKSAFGVELPNLIFDKYDDNYVKFLEKKIHAMDNFERETLNKKFQLYQKTKNDKNSIDYIQLSNDLSEDEYFMFNSKKLNQLLA